MEIAATPAARQCGLSHRKVLDSDRGMLFVFEHDQKLHFWMKDTAIPLSIVYIDANRTIREHHDLKPYFTELVSSESLLRYALEANRGWFDDNNIKPGDKVTFALPEGMVTRP